MDKVSIIVTHWAQNEFRSEMMRKCMASIFQTAPQAELIVVDNGGSTADTMYLANLADEGHIACYIRNRHNMSFGYARNQAIKMATGEYLVVADNDIGFETGWLEECIAYLKRNTKERQVLCTPMKCDIMNNRPRRWRGELDGWRLNERAGSNCTVMARRDFDAIGWYDQDKIAGSKWTNRYVRMGYLMAVMPTPKAKHLAYQQGYNIHKDIEHFSL